MNRYPLLTGLATHLSARLTALLTRPIAVTVHRVPDPAPGKITPTMPYAIVYAGGGANLFGSFQLPHKNGSVAIQVTSVGSSYSQAESMADKVRSIVLDPTQRPPIQGFTVMDIEPDGGPETPEEAAENLFSVVERFQVFLANQE